jgi:DNA (cytosine-5)-methyltransferase 1
MTSRNGTPRDTLRRYASRSMFENPIMSSQPATSYVTAGLFAGIGGFERGLAAAGHSVELLCEIDPLARAVLRKRLPETRLHDDITTLASIPRRVDLVVGGFPCQDLSQAGRTAGIEGARSGLVGEVFRLLEQRRVKRVLLENVPFMLQLAGGRAMDVIVDTLERLGYKWAYRVVDARSFGLPQRRQRVFLLASLDGDPRDVLYADEVGPPEVEPFGEPVAFGFYWTEGIKGLGWAANAVPTLKGGSTVGVPSPPAVWLPSGRIVTIGLRDAERLQGFPADWTSPAETVGRRGMRWKLVGNAVSVPVAKWLGRRLAKPGRFQERAMMPLFPGMKWPSAAWNVGDGRFTTELSMWPVRKEPKLLHEFIAESDDLSPRATAGFLSRTQRSSLRFPPGFLDAVRRHLDRVRLPAAS